MTKFQILAQDDPTTGWHEHSSQEAHNSAEAIKKAYLLTSPLDVIAMVAVPARSWKPQQIRTETVTKVVLGEEKQEA